MSGRIPSRRERLRRAEEHSEKLKDQMSNANDFYEDARDLQDAVDPSIGDFQLPDSIGRMATETIEFREQRKAFKADLEVLTEEAIELEEESHLLTMELQDTQITNEEPEEFTKKRLAAIKRLFEADSKLTALVFEDQSLFDDAIRDVRAQGNQYLTKLHSLMEEVQSLKDDIHSANEHYDERLGNLVQPILQELGDAKQQLEASKALQSSTDEELANVKEQLSTVTQAHQTSEIALKEKALKLNERDAIIAAKSSKLDDREALIQRKSQELQADIKVHVANQAHNANEVSHLVAREANLRIAEDAIEKRSESIEQRRKADEEIIQRREDNLKRHQQLVMQLHQMTGDKLDSLREERAEERRQQESFVSYSIATRQELKVEAAKVNGLIKKLRNLKSSIATPLQNCEVALANIKERAQSLNLAEAGQQITALKNKLVLVSFHTDRQKATLSTVSKAIEAVDTERTRLMDNQFEDISAKLANVSEVSAGLDVLSTRFQDMQVAESNATDRMTGAAEELRNATATGSKAREALQQVLVRSNATIFNDNTAKRGAGAGAGLSSPEKPATKRRRPRHVRGSSAGAAEVLANVEAPELLVNTIQTFGSPSQRRIPLFNTPRTASGGFGQLAPFAGHLTGSRSGASSSAVNLVFSSPGTIIPSSQSDPSDLAMASDHVRNVWRQIKFPANWTTSDSAKLLVALNEAKERKGGKHNRYWPQQAMDAGSGVTKPYCLTRDLKRLGMLARPDGKPCDTHPSGTVCIDVFHVIDSPGEYDSEATDKRWRLEKRQ